MVKRDLDQVPAHARRKRPKIARKSLQEILKIPNDPGASQEPDGLLDSPDQVVEAETLSPIEVHVHCERSRGNLDNIFQAASEKGINIPNHNIRCPHDPRLMTSTFALKDSIRRLYNCQDIGMDINSLRLHHSSLLGDAETDILTYPWVETLELFDGIDPTYYVYVAFAPVDDPEESIYESFEAPSELRTFLDLQDSDVKLNSSRIGTRKVRVGKYLLQSDIDVDPLEEIGAAPEPKVFPSKQEQRRYCSGFDIDKEEGFRK